LTTVQIIELVGSSPDSWQDAVKTAVKDTSKTIRNLQGVDVLGHTAVVKDGEIVEYRANLRLSFKVEENRAK
jgi:flavin-binding protein dodecin